MEHIEHLIKVFTRIFLAMLSKLSTVEMNLSNILF